VAEGVALLFLSEYFGWRFIWVLAGSSLYATAQLVTTIALTRLGGPRVIGDYGLALAVMAPLFMLAHLGLRRVLATDVDHRFELGDCLRLQMLTGGLAIGVLAIVGAVWLPADVGLLLAVGVKRMFESLGEVVFGAFQRLHQEGRIAMSLAVRSAADVGVVIAVYSISRNLTVAVLAASATSLLVLVALDLPVAQRHSHTTFSRSSGRRGLLGLGAYSAPAGATAMMTSLNSNISRYFIERYHGRTALGYFVPLLQLLQIGVFVNAALSQAALPALAEKYRQSAHDFRVALARLCVVQFAMQVVPMGLMAMIGARILALLYKPEYAQYASVSVLLFAGGAVRAITAGLAAAQTVLGILQKEAVTTGVSLVATLSLCALLIPQYGLVGAAIALIIAAVINVALGARAVAVALAAGPSNVSQRP
jgi:O-antigen/teichoic acid export membrane protein